MTGLTDPDDFWATVSNNSLNEILNERLELRLEVERLRTSVVYWRENALFHREQHDKAQARLTALGHPLAANTVPAERDTTAEARALIAEQST